MSPNIPNETFALQMKCMECYAERDTLKAENRQLKDILEMSTNIINSMIINIESDIDAEEAESLNKDLRRIRTVLEAVGKGAKLVR